MGWDNFIFLKRLVIAISLGAEQRPVLACDPGYQEYVTCYFSVNNLGSTCTVNKVTINSPVCCDIFCKRAGLVDKFLLSLDVI